MRFLLSTLACLFVVALALAGPAAASPASNKAQLRERALESLVRRGYPESRIIARQVNDVDPSIPTRGDVGGAIVPFAERDVQELAKRRAAEQQLRK